MNQQTIDKSVRDTTKSNIEAQGHSLKELYQARRNGRLSIFGTALAGYSAFYEWAARILGGGAILLTSPFAIHIPDGYALVLLSIPVLAWWIFYGLFYIAICAIGLGICISLSAPYPALFIYTGLEFIASVTNRDLDKHGEHNYKEWNFFYD